MSLPLIVEVRVEHYRGSVLGLDYPLPRISWITETDQPGWEQSGYELEIDGVAKGLVTGGDSVLVPWPAAPLISRQRSRVRVRVVGTDDSASDWSRPLELEMGLLTPADWSARWITGVDEPSRPNYFRRTFTTRPEILRARLYATSAGLNEIHLNGKRVSDTVLDPGWTSYSHRLHYATHDVTDLLTAGENAIGAVVADGWWRGHLGWDMKRNLYGDKLGLLAQLEVTYADGSQDTIVSDLDWRSSHGPMLNADLYNGESYDARLEEDRWDLADFDDSAWTGTSSFEPDVGDLVASKSPPVRRMEELPVREIIVTPSGKTILDFGQNLVGWVRFTVEGDAGGVVTLRHAEVLEHGELGTRPLRNARATDQYILRGNGPETWEPAFTFHGFRYVEVTGWPGVVDPTSVVAVVVHSDLHSTGEFSCSDDLLNRLHENVVWGMKGNFVDVPTDCPQRDERLGWTGDIQVFGPTATFLFDVSGFLADWLEDLRAEENPDGSIPLVVPGVTMGPPPLGGAQAAWGDVSTFLPWTLYERYGDVGLLSRHFPSMRKWVELLRSKAGDRLLWPEGFQLGDWLDPDAPPEDASKAKTPGLLVADAYFARSTQIVSDAARVLGFKVLAQNYQQLAANIRKAFRDEYMEPDGVLKADSMTAYALAIEFDLYETGKQRARGGKRIAELAEANGYRIGTGFVGTPLLLHALSAVGDTETAYRLLTETSCPSWLYPITMGATTIWERWDSMRPDGTINPGEMTSFNHYALGAVADWMHQTVGGIAAMKPGFKSLRFAPVPGRHVTSAACALETPYGRASCEWRLLGAEMVLDVTVPPNTSASVVRPGHPGEAVEVLSGQHAWRYEVDTATLAQWADTPGDTEVRRALP